MNIRQPIMEREAIEVLERLFPILIDQGLFKEDWAEKAIRILSHNPGARIDRLAPRIKGVQEMQERLISIEESLRYLVETLQGELDQIRKEFNLRN